MIAADFLLLPGRIPDDAQSKDARTTPNANSLPASLHSLGLAKGAAVSAPLPPKKFSKDSTMTSFSQAPTRRSLLRRCRSLALLLATAVLGTVLSGCGGSTTSTTTHIRTLNAYIASAGVDGSLTISTSAGSPLTAVGTPLGFGQFAIGGGYTILNSGTITITASGTSLATPISLTSTYAGNNTQYTLAAIGQEGQVGTFVPQLISIPNFVANQMVIPSGDAAIRVVNLSLNTNPIGLYNTVAGVPNAIVATGTSNIAYGYSAANAYVNVPTTQLSNFAIIDTSNVTTALSLSSSTNLNTFTFTSGQAYTLFVFGQPGNATDPLNAIWVEDYP